MTLAIKYNPLKPHTLQHGQTVRGFVSFDECHRIGDKRHQSRAVSMGTIPVVAGVDAVWTRYSAHAISVFVSVVLYDAYALVNTTFEFSSNSPIDVWYN